MLIRVSIQKEDEVARFLSKADDSSFSYQGSNYDSLSEVFLNGALRPVRSKKCSWTSVQDSSFEEKEQDPGPMPGISGIFRAAIVQIHKHYGGNLRPRAKVVFFSRLDSLLFLSIDIGEVEGWRPSLIGGPSIPDAIWGACKKIRVKIDSEATTRIVAMVSQRPAMLWNGFGLDTPQYGGEEWFEKAIKASVGLKKALCSVEGFLNGVKGPEKLFRSFCVLLEETPMGEFLNTIVL